ncbi:MAG: cohesin domain-containing protein, partial [Acidobacteriota bacterium]|nr:cohesin domain-containing protein [Acidobacteriota bacterium]
SEASEPARRRRPSEEERAPAEAGPGEAEAVPVPRPDAGAQSEEERARVSPAQVRLTPDKSAVAPGDAVAIDVEVSEATNASTINFQLRYDPTILQFVPPADVGEFLSQGGAFADLQAVESAEGGLIVVSVARSGPEGATGSGRLVRLNFVALREGRSGFNFSAAQIRDPDSRPLPATFRTTSVEVKP